MPAVLPHGVLRLWTGRVADLAADATAHEHLLDPSERARLSALRREADRDQYRTAHVALRRLLAGHLAEDPARMVIVRRPCAGCGGPHGRPALPGDPVHFSLSHAGDRILIALAGTDVGVDIERLPHPRTADRVARVLHPRESAELSALPYFRRPAAFARCWTRKEALLKAAGTGLTVPPSTHYVGTTLRPPDLPGWRLADLPSDSGYAAACAVREDAGAQAPPPV